ncbi:hypothetical protein ES703_45766 [subsurface metagenome]
MNTLRPVTIWMVVYLCGCGVPTTSSRCSEKPIQTYGTQDYQVTVEYSIQAELLGMQGEIQGSEDVCFVNSTGSELDRLYCFLPLDEVKLDSKDCSVESIEDTAVPKHIKEGRFFQLSLKSPIGTGEKQQFRFEFSGVIPPDDKYASGAVSGSFWHPILFALAPSEASWSDWFKLIPPAIFEVTLTVPSDHNVATSAQKVREYSKQQGCKTIEAYSKGDRFFKWRSSPNYYVVSSKSPTGKILVYFTDRESLQGPFVAEVASEVSCYYAELLGGFPFPFVCFVPGRQDVSGGGEAGPRMLMLHKMHSLPVPGQGKDLKPTRWIVGHELGHLYWSELGYVEIREDVGWLALGLGMWTDQQYAERIGRKTIVQDNFRRYIAAAKAGYNTTIHQSEEQLKDAPFNVNHVIRHSKGFTVVSMLEYLMGKQRFSNFLKDLLARYGGRTKVLTEHKFCSLAQDYYGTDLRWFFDQWLDTNKSLDYGLESVTKHRNQLQVEVRRLGEAIMPVCVQVVTKKGKVIRKRIQGQAQVETVYFDELGSLWLEVILDPEERLPDLNRSNNMVKRSKSD